MMIFPNSTSAKCQNEDEMGVDSPSLHTESQTVTESSEIAKLLAANFIERRDVRAIQSQTGAYMPHRKGPDAKYENRTLQPFDLDALVKHVEGKFTFGHYLVKPETDTCRMFCFDIDFNKDSVYFPNGPDEPSIQINPREVWAGPTTQVKKDLALQIRVLAEGLAIRAKKLIECKVIVAYSGNKGFHVIGCMPPGSPAVEVRECALLVLESFQSFIPLKGKNFWRHDTGFPSLEIEVFPKQDEVKADGYGNLVRLPLGINRKSGKPGFFVRLDTPIDQFKIDDPKTVLELGSLRG